MYDRMFAALDQQERVSSDVKVEYDDSEMETMRNKARQEMQQKISELETKVEEKTKAYEKSQEVVQELTGKNEEQIGQIEKLSGELVVKSDEIKRLTSQMEFLKQDHDMKHQEW